jgi:hypothetical protein
VNWEAISAIGQVAGAAAVVVTLAYLARQIRDNTNAVQGAMEMEVAHQLANWNATRPPEERMIWSRAARGEELSETEATAFVWMTAGYFFLCEGWYRQFKRGLMKAEVWEEHADGAVGMLASPYIRAWWEHRVSSLSPEFRSYIEQRRAARPGGWTLKPVLGALDGKLESSQR